MSAFRSKVLTNPIPIGTKMDRSVKLAAITRPEIDGVNSAEEFIAYCARVSNPTNQMNTETAGRLLKYCIDNDHWSLFETVSLTLEI